MKKLLVIAMLSGFFAAGTLYAETWFNCNRCNQTGRVTVTREIKCHACRGIKTRCSGCRGTGRRISYGFGPATSEPCIDCLGTGQNTCYTCWDTGKILLTGTATCKQCNGKGRFKL